MVGRLLVDTLCDVTAQKRQDSTLLPQLCQQSRVKVFQLVGATIQRVDRWVKAIAKQVMVLARRAGVTSASGSNVTSRLNGATGQAPKCRHLLCGSTGGGGGPLGVLSEVCCVLESGG